MIWVFGLFGAAALLYGLTRGGGTAAPPPQPPAPETFSASAQRADALLSRAGALRTNLEGSLVDSSRLESLEMLIAQAREVRERILGEERVDPTQARRLAALEAELAALEHAAPILAGGRWR